MPKLGKRDFPGLKGRLIHSWPKANGRDVVVVNSWEYYGRKLVDIRVWYLDEEGDRRRPGKGVRLRRDEFRYLRKVSRLLKDTE